MANHLQQEKSPYLLQHAENPVDWYPWGPEALEKARREAFRKVMVAYDALKSALSEGKTEKQISTLLDRYVEAMKTSREVEAKFTPVLTRIVSVEKVAKLFIGEEEFRRMQIGRWGEKKD